MIAQEKLCSRCDVAAPNVNGIGRQPIMIMLAVVVAAAAIWFGLPQLDGAIRMTFVIFVVAIVGWVFTRIEDSYVALAAAMALVLVGVETPEGLFESLGDSMVWLLIAAFIIAAAVSASGLSSRLAAAVVSRARSVDHLFYLLTMVMVLTALFIPSTSGRAALMLPVFMALSSVIGNARIVKALALLFPTVILLSAIGSLIGAGAHLIAADVIFRMTGESIGFLRWMLLGMPLALISSFASTWVILRMFLNAKERREPLTLNVNALGTNDLDASALDARSLDQRSQDKLPQVVSSPRFTIKESYMLLVICVVVLLWCTEPLHGVDNTIVAIFGALAATARYLGPITLKQGIKSVEWNLILFMAATLKLSEVLVDTGGAQWLVTGLFDELQGMAGNVFLMVAGLAIVALCSHLAIASRSARAAILIPMTILLSLSLGYNAAAVAFMAVAATGFCLTLTVSAKPMAMFSQLSVPTYTPGDLLRLSGTLLPLHFVLMMVFAFVVWPRMGLPVISEENVANASSSLTFEKNAARIDRGDRAAVVGATASDARLALKAGMGSGLALHEVVAGVQHYAPMSRPLLITRQFHIAHALHITDPSHISNPSLRASSIDAQKEKADEFTFFGGTIRF